MAEAPESLAEPFPAVSEEEWRAHVERELGEKDRGGEGFAELRSRLDGGLEIEPLYTARYLEVADPAGFPGLPPFARGGSPLPRDGGWVVCAQEPADLAHGARGLWLRPSAGGPLASQLEERLAGVDPERTTLLLVPGAEPGAALAAAESLAGFAAGRGADPRKLTGCLGGDPLAEDLPLLAAWSREQAPGMRPVLLGSHRAHEAGLSASRELALLLASGAEALRRLESGGLDPAELGEAFLLDLAVGPDLFAEIAKLRAARLLWSKVLHACGAANVAPQLHAGTSFGHRTEELDWNALRATAEGFAAAVGGADLVTLAARDAAAGGAAGSPTGRRLAVNVQHVLREECALGRVLDPAGGSYYLETLTLSLARAAWEDFQEIEAAGGIREAPRETLAESEAPA